MLFISHIRDIYAYTLKSLVGKGTRYEYHIPLWGDTPHGMKPIVEVKGETLIVIFTPIEQQTLLEETASVSDSLPKALDRTCTKHASL